VKLGLPARLIASFFLIGEKAPFAPATWASLATLPFLYGFVQLPILWQATIIVVVSVLGTWVSTLAEDEYGHDGSPIVIDEVAGMLVTFAGISFAGLNRNWLYVLAGFLLFRLFDIVKPFPIGRLQHLPKGYGVMADDLLAGVYANVALRLIMEYL
jgi:phosphatidylglycerophosphatase A